MILRVEVKNEILGNSVFWEGPSSNLADIKNIPARMLAEKVATDGKTRKGGMWLVSVVEEEEEVGPHNCKNPECPWGHHRKEATQCCCMACVGLVEDDSAGGF